MRWFFPSWNGDHRLVVQSAMTCTLEVDKPTAGEAKALNKFLKKAKSKDWIDEPRVIETSDKLLKPILLQAPVDIAGELLTSTLRVKKGRITAVRYENDEVIVETTKNITLDKGKKAKAAVTTKRGTMSCPAPVPVNERASEALMAFLDDEQLAQWATERRIVAYGGFTGVAYVIGHRGGDFAERNGYICRSIDDDAAVHYYDWSVPPEEEVLGLKIILEHREDWVRNPSGCFVRDGVRFHNPLGDDTMDGMKDAAFVSNLGAGFIDGVQVAMKILGLDKKKADDHD